PCHVPVLLSASNIRRSIGCLDNIMTYTRNVRTVKGRFRSPVLVPPQRDSKLRRGSLCDPAATCLPKRYATPVIRLSRPRVSDAAAILGAWEPHALAVELGCRGGAATEMNVRSEIGKVVGFELDHVLIWVGPGAPEAEGLIAFGLTEGTPNVHTGQGTA